jgi:flagellar basal-body rod modification protein FlgD
MQVQSTTESSAAQSIASAATGGLQGGDLGKEAFLQLLVTQLKNQDPLSPMENTEFIGQLSQFSSLEQLTNISEAIGTQSDQTQALNNTMMTNLIGRNVSVQGSQLQYQEDSTTQMGFDLPVAASITVEIKNSDGKTIRTMEMGPKEAGSHIIDWDGKDGYGNEVEEGYYTFEIEATNAAGEKATVSSYLIGQVSGMRFVDGSPVMFMGNQAISPSDIIAIYDASQFSDS